MKTLSIFLLCATPYMVSSQGNRTPTNLDWARERDIFVTRLYGFIPSKEKYHYVDFRDGNVFYASHKESSSIKLNYNLYLQKIEMINEKGDTVFLPNFEIIKYILLDKDLYYHDVKKGYFELLGNPNDSHTIGRSTTIKYSGPGGIIQYRKATINLLQRIIFRRISSS